MARPTLAQDSKTFLTALRKLGSSAGNGALRQSLGWTDGRYWKVHETLFTSNRIVKGRGRGGSVAIA